MTATLDPFIDERVHGTDVQIPAGLVRARGAFAATLDAMAQIGDDRLASAWDWDGTPQEVRYGFYRVYEMLEGAAFAAARALRSDPSTEARDAVGAAAASRWAIHGVLTTLSDADLDADPGNGEWTIRRTMQHIINSQRGYAWGSAAWMELGIRGDLGDRRLPDNVYDGHPDEEEEALGSLAEIRRELDDIVDVTASRFASLSADDLAVMGRANGKNVPLMFRQWRWSSHMAEHTVQLEKTIDMLGKRRTEVDWLSRLNARAFGRLGSVVFGRTSAGDAAPILEQVARDLDVLRTEVVAAAEAGKPAQDW